MNGYSRWYMPILGSMASRQVELPSTLNMRIPRLSDNTPESISGEIYLDLYANNPFSPFDTIRYELYIVDRALHHSNTITTTEYVTN